MANAGWDDKSKGSGKSPTKFMEKPGKKPEKREPQEGDTGIGEGNAEFLEQQEKTESSEQDSMLNELGQSPKKDASKKDAPKQDSSSDDDKGDCACT